MGHQEVSAILNVRLSEELAAINQYVVHSGMCDRWGYKTLAKYVLDRAKGEMKHTDMLIDRILYLGDLPVVNVLGPINIGIDVRGQLENDEKAEATAIDNYNSTIAFCAKEGDSGTRGIIEEILEDEEEHRLEILEKLSSIEQVGIQNFLASML